MTVAASRSDVHRREPPEASWRGSSLYRQDAKTPRTAELTGLRPRPQQGMPLATRNLFTGEAAETSQQAATKLPFFLATEITEITESTGASPQTPPEAAPLDPFLCLIEGR